MQKEASNTKDPDQSASSSRTNTPANDQVDSKEEVSKSIANNKRKMPGQTSGSNIVPNKKARQNDNGNGDEDITEESVRRYLMRKPMTLTELLKKLRCKRSSLDKNALGQKIAFILKKINPERQKIKDKLYLSVRPDQP